MAKAHAALAALEKLFPDAPLSLEANKKRAPVPVRGGLKFAAKVTGCPAIISARYEFFLLLPGNEANLTCLSFPVQPHNPGFGMGGPMHKEAPPPPNLRGRGRGGSIRGRGRGRGFGGANHGNYMNAGEEPCPVPWACLALWGVWGP